MSDRNKAMLQRMKALGLDTNSLVMGDNFSPASMLATGQPEVDAILDTEYGPGIPDGTLCEFVGESQSGKTYLALKVIAQAQSLGHRCAYFNIENAFYEPRAKSIGVNVRDEETFVMIENLEYAEAYETVARDMLDNPEIWGKFKVLVIDSITALVPKNEYDKEFDKISQIGIQATNIQRFLKALMHRCAKTGTIVIIINQFRMADSGFPAGGMVRKSTGGKSLEYFTHMRLGIDRINGKDGAVIGEEGEVIGGKSRLKVMKSRYGKALDTIFPIYFEKQKVNPIGEFLYRAAARNKEYVRVSRKIYFYDREAGEEPIKHKEPNEFIRLLMACPAPTTLPRGVVVNSAFEWIANRLKLTPSEIDGVNEALNSEAMIHAPNDTEELVSNPELAESLNELEDDD